MTYQDIEAFLEIVQTGSVTRAAENLAVTQPTLSHRLKALENELGMSLLKREKGIRRVELTDAGRSFIPIAEKWKQLWLATSMVAGDQRTKTLNIAAAHSINSYIMPTVYRNFLMAHPDLTISLCTHHSNEAYRAMETGEADIAFIANPMHTQRVATIPLFKEKMVLISGDLGLCETTGLSPSNLNVRDEIQLDWSRDFLLWHEYWFGNNPRPRIFTDDMKILENLIGQDRNWAITPISAAKVIAATTPDIYICTLRDAPPDRITYMLSKRSQDQGRETVHLVELLEDRIRQSEGFTLFEH